MPALDKDVVVPGPGCTVSIVIPNYNHGRFLPRCLEAIERQTRNPHEVLLIDDASTDNSLDVIAGYAERLPGFRLIRHQTNLGVVAGLNEGLRLASGTHVLFAAADDWIEPGLIAESSRWLEQYPQVGLCSALTRLADEKGNVIGPFRTPLPRWTPGHVSPEEAVRQLAKDDTWFNGNTTIVNRSAAIAAGGYRPELASFCDGFLNASLAWRHGACFLPRFLAVWRRLDSGYAASLNLDPERLVRIFHFVQEFEVPQPYLKRWVARWQFTAACLAITLGREAPRARLGSILPPRVRSLTTALALLARIPRLGFRVSRLLLFLILRGGDLGPAVRRRLEWMLFGPVLGARS